MDIYRKKSKLALNSQPSNDAPNEDAASKTPARLNSHRSEDEDSPYFTCSTQELREDVDVLWDYNSPQSRPKGSVVRKSKKRLNLQQSPKVPMRRHPSNNNHQQIKQDFCKLREELRALKAEIAKPDHEESLILSPREEVDFKGANFIEVIDEQPVEEEDCGDPFADGMDDKLILFSKQVEQEIERVYKTLDSDSSGSSTKCDNVVKSKKTPSRPQTEESTLQRDYRQKPDLIKKTLHSSDIFNDSLDNLITEMNEDVFEQLTQVVELKQCKHAPPVLNSDKNQKVFPRSVSENSVKSFGFTKTIPNKVEWHRTQSFENYAKVELSQDVLLDIERKRLEAKAKLQAKKQQESANASIPAEISDSPLRCSAEEIEKKRKEALAKLEAKRQQELIERKKQEALRRREESRRKHASQVKTSLSSRLQL